MDAWGPRGIWRLTPFTRRHHRGCEKWTYKGIYFSKVTALYCHPMNAFRCAIFRVPTPQIVAVSLLLLLVNLQSPPIRKLSPIMTRCFRSAKYF